MRLLGFPVIYLGWAYLFWVPIFNFTESVWWFPRVLFFRVGGAGPLVAGVTLAYLRRGRGIAHRPVAAIRRRSPRLSRLVGRHPVGLAGLRSHQVGRRADAERDGLEHPGRGGVSGDDEPVRRDSRSRAGNISLPAVRQSTSGYDSRPDVAAFGLQRTFPRITGDR